MESNSYSLNLPEKTKSSKIWPQAFSYDLVKTRLSESEAEAGEPNQSQSVGTCIVIGLSFRFCFWLRQSGCHWIIKRNVSDGVVSRVGRNWHVLILLTPIPSRLWLRLRLRFLIFTTSYALFYDSDSVASENHPLWNLFAERNRSYKRVLVYWKSKGYGLFIWKVLYFTGLSVEKKPLTNAAISCFWNWLQFLIDFRFANFRMIWISAFLVFGIGGFHAISGDTNNNGEMNKCWWTNKTS